MRGYKKFVTRKNAEIYVVYYGQKISKIQKHFEMSQNRFRKIFGESILLAPPSLSNLFLVLPLQSPGGLSLRTPYCCDSTCFRSHNFIDLGFHLSVHVSAVYIYETFNPGAVFQLWGGDGGRYWEDFFTKLESRVFLLAVTFFWQGRWNDIRKTVKRFFEFIRYYFFRVFFINKKETQLPVFTNLKGILNSRNKLLCEIFRWCSFLIPFLFSGDRSGRWCRLWRRSQADNGFPGEGQTDGRREESYRGSIFVGVCRT